MLPRLVTVNSLNLLLETELCLIIRLILFFWRVIPYVLKHTFTLKIGPYLNGQTKKKIKLKTLISEPPF